MVVVGVVVLLLLVVRARLEEDASDFSLSSLRFFFFFLDAFLSEIPPLRLRADAFGFGAFQSFCLLLQLTSEFCFDI